MASKTRHEVTDVIVVGGSVGGLAVGIMVADHGGRTVIVERQRILGGSAAPEPEHLAAPASRLQRAAGIDDSPAALVDDLVAETQHKIDPALAALVAEQGAPLVDWLIDRCGLPLELVAASAYRGHSRPRLHSMGPQGGAALIEALERIVSRHHRIRVLRGVVVTSISRDTDGRGCGVELESPRRSDPKAMQGAVVLACGGYAAADELIGRVAPNLAAFPARGCPTATGDGIRLAEKVEAKLESLGACAVTALLATPSDLNVDPTIVSYGAILVNQAGRRFVDETAEPIVVAETMAAQPGRLGYLIFDQRIADAAGTHNPHLARTVLPRVVRRATTVAELARQLELDEAGLALTLDTYNANVDLGGDPFGRDRATNVLRPPLLAIRVIPARRRSLGGVAIDAAARVLGVDGAPIANLYAVGGIVGGLGRGGSSDEIPGMAPLITLATARLVAAAWQAGHADEES